MKINVTHIAKAKLSCSDVWDYFLVRDNGGRWETNSETPEYVNEYLQGYRSPSRAYPKSYFQALRTVKFAKFLTVHDPDLAVEIGVAKREETKL